MVRKAAEAAGSTAIITITGLKSDENYIAAFEQARMMAGDKAEDEVYRRGIEGFDHPVIYQAGITLQGPTQINSTIKGDSPLPSTTQDLLTVSN